MHTEKMAAGNKQKPESKTEEKVIENNSTCTANKKQIEDKKQTSSSPLKHTHHIAYYIYHRHTANIY